jgi:hypothetical protein
MKIKRLLFPFFLLSFLLELNAQGILINHNCIKINDIPETAILTAKNNLHIAYGHTSHGSQLISGMDYLDAFMGGTGLYNWHNGIEEGSLDIDDYFVDGDLGNPDRTTWAERTRAYLNDSQNSDVNVVIWSWCGEVSSASEDDINTYLNLMNSLETDYPNVKFVYMTGHLDGSGLEGNLHIRNEQIRNYCKTNNKILYDFNDIECYDPDGNYFGDKYPDDACNYNDNGNTGNWAIEWQNSHTVGVDWYNCDAAHSQALNGNQKAYAAWWLWATLTGWNDISAVYRNNKLTHEIKLENNYPNPFNPSTNIIFTVTNNIHVRLDIFNSIGEHIITLTDKNYSFGNYSLTWNGTNNFGKEVNSGIYIYRINSGNFSQSKSMILLK